MVAFLSLAVLFGATASSLVTAFPVHSPSPRGIVFGTAATKDHAVKCPYDDENKHTLSGNNINVQLQFHSYCDRNCLYEVIGGFMDPFTGQKEPAVAKTPRLDLTLGADEAPVTPNERDALGTIQMLFTSEEVGGKPWVILKEIPGVPVVFLDSFTKQFPDDYSPVTDVKKDVARYSACVQYMEALYNSVVDAIEPYATEYGWIPDVGDWSTILFTGGDRPQVGFTNWEKARQLRGNKQFAWALQSGSVRSILRNSLLSIHDTEKGFGMCESQRVAKGERWQAPSIF